MNALVRDFAAETISPLFFKGHGQGNDYIVVRYGPGPRLDAALARRICDRRRGVGADGIVAAGPGEGGVDAQLRMFNPDGSEFERSGNGLRVAALYLLREGIAEEGGMRVAVGGDEIQMRVLERAGRDWNIRVEMGRATFPAGPPFVRADRVRVRRSGPPIVELGVEGLSAVPVSVGNPHAVLFRERWTVAETRRLGPRISSCEAFPRGVNVQFVELASMTSESFRLAIWERGAGETASSGTSACAAAAAGVASGYLKFGRCTANARGGPLEVSVSSRYEIALAGPVREICEGTLCAALTEAGI